MSIFDEEKKKPSEKNVFVKLQTVMNDSTFLKNLRTVIILIIVFGVPMLYFGFFDNISWDVLFSFKLGGLALMSAVLVTMVRLDTKARAFDDELSQNQDLIKVEYEIEEKTDGITDHVSGLKFVEKHNEEQQTLADQRAFDKKMNALKRQMASLQVANKMTTKKYLRLEKAVNSLKIKGAKGKYDPIAYDELVSLESARVKRDTSARNKINYNPKKENIFAAFGNTFMKSIGIGGTGTIPFMIGSDAKTILIFYGALVIAVISTFLQTYLKVRLKTGKKYLAARKFKLGLLTQCVKFIEEHQKEQKAFEQMIADWVAADLENKQFDKAEALAKAQIKPVVESLPKITVVIPPKEKARIESEKMLLTEEQRAKASLATI